MKLRVGDWVEVRGKEEILATLDKKGRMERLPFMPQMFQYCGQRFQVYKRAHKTCDWVYTEKSRRLPNGIHLDLRCDGKAYGGCQAACIIYWKEAWLKPVDEKGNVIKDYSLKNKQVGGNGFCAEADVMAATSLGDDDDVDGPSYTCQGTELPDFTTPISRWNISQYVEDYTSGNVTLGQLFKGFVYVCFWKLSNSGLKLGKLLRIIYDALSFLWGPYPRRSGVIEIGQPTPTCDLNLQEGELVRVKSYDEILKTLNKKRQNRGLSFDAEQVPYCGGVYRVRTRMTRFIEEKTRKIVHMKSVCILLEGVTCQSRYSECRMLCPRSILSWWHEIWLERVSEGTQSTPKQEV